MPIDQAIQDHIKGQLLERDVALREKFEADCRECRHAIREDIHAIQLNVTTTDTDRKVLASKLDEVKDGVDSISGQIQAFATAIATQAVKDQTMIERLKGISLVVYGNGEPGLKGQVGSLMETRSNMRWGFGFLWSGIIAIAAALLKVWYSK